MTDAPSWSRGFDLQFLKELAAVYRQAFKPHTYGAFGIPKERDVADAMAEGQVIWTRGQTGAPTGVAIFRIVQREQPHFDFAGRAATMRPGDLFIKSLAGTPEGMKKVVEALRARSGLRPTWCEAHVENAEAVAVLAELGFAPALTKVAASSDLKGLFLVGGDLGRCPPPLDAADCPGVKVLQDGFINEEDQRAVLAELEAFGDHFAQHYSSYNKRSSWTAFALHGYSYEEPDFIIKPAEMSKGWKAENAGRLEEPCGPTKAASHFPHTLSILDRIPHQGVQRVRFMRLSGGGGELTRHADITDPEAGTADGKIARLHVPIRTDPRCLFRSWMLNGEELRLHMPERGLSYIDTRKPHAVINPAEAERIHLVIDAVSGPGLREWLAA